MTSMRFLAMVLLVSLTTAACSDLPSGPLVDRGPVAPNSAIVDAAHSGTVPGFYFLPPMVSNPSYSGEADPGVGASVDICELDAAATNCAINQPSGFPIVFPHGAGGVEYGGSHYQVNWKTKDYQLDDSKYYRITIRVGDRELGFADVDVVDGGNQLRNVDTNEYIALKDGRTLPINFRVETGILGSLSISPTNASIESTESQGYSVSAVDLHGAPLSGVGLSWVLDPTVLAELQGASAATDVSGAAGATVQALGSPGQVSVAVSSQGLSAGAVLTIQDPPPSEVHWVQVVLGAYAACGLADNGKAYCWGDGSRGVLGNGTFADSSIPVEVQAPVTFVDLAMTRSHACGTAVGGEVYCWGENPYGQIGDGTTSTHSVPVRAVPGTAFQQIAPGGDHTCGLRDDGAVLCWGKNDFGQLGTGNSTNSMSPQVVSLSGTVVQIESAHNATCVLYDTGDVDCWGYNPYGNLGVGTTAGSVPSPTRVLGGHHFVAIEAGIWGGCHLTSTGEVYCMGLGRDGTLGNGTNTYSQSTPTQVLGGAMFVAVSGGGDANCAIATDGTPMCWGIGYGVGYGSTANVNIPTVVSGGLSAVVIRAAGSYGCLIDAASALYCWGVNTSGRLGDGTATNRLTPVQVMEPQ